ncbi:hypothetical protein HMPREF9582_01320 [Cutibacterium acnes HL060PA1]|nr:hypothetical protein HMPREF9603_01095 [Cutibacterium acnes HL001PA1]EFT64148.1 hypothetical protein HMPREF9578_00099 [Cutibacterium acnes HL110PA4]EFT64871.1 hypothetical protein HMPREF9582_01320 [Cutibacterium acnes HL060PA1]EFT75559.1 hypothetical protein HMPREF9599_00815 [Cutibacterium acnes HL050PA2]
MPPGDGRRRRRWTGQDEAGTPLTVVHRILVGSSSFTTLTRSSRFGQVA